MTESERRLAEAVRRACIRAAAASYEAARMDGLCDDGAFEVALDAVRGLDLQRLVASADTAEGNE